MLTMKVPLRAAEQAKQDLIRRGLFVPGYGVPKESEHLYFPVKERFDAPYDFVERDLDERPGQPGTLKEALAGKLPTDALDKLKTAYDQVGSIAILEIDEDYRQYDALIGKTLLLTNPKTKTVLAKDSRHEGTFRTQQMRLLAGEDTRLAEHKENGVVLAVDVEEVYFSTRLSTERKRIAGLVQPGERVLVMFSGCGPYTCVLAKNTAAREVVGVEINPRGHELALQNIARNKLLNATAYCGDVREVVPCLGAFDRVVMPLPKAAETFLDVALAAANDGATIHFYAFLPEDASGEAHGWIRDACQRSGRPCKVLGTVRCGQQAPRVCRFCVDFALSK
ncbi:class I SAM-dependent methyltransferase family protein [Candidatus Woesearchaeota archaeon]|nr:class I SAM-dependent methyltransferase family protein [Candidatus Woesearchaeota archaeon]